MMSDADQFQVLIIEDDRDTSDNLRDILELDGYTIRVVSTAATAIRDLSLGKADVILLDRKLPDGTAETVLPQLRELAPQAAVIVVTGYADLQSSIAALRLGAADYLLKPINADELRRSIRRIVELRRMQQALEDREARLQVILDTAIDAIITCDDTGLIETINPAAEQMFEYMSDELLGRNIRRLMPEMRIFGETISQTRIGQREARGFRQEMTGQRRDGTLFPAHVSLFVVSLPGQQLFTAFIHDISDLKLAQERMLQSERLAAIGKAMTGLVHESRNALQRSQAGLERLSRRVGHEPGVQNLIDGIQRAQDDLHRLYEEVREYAAPVRINPQLLRLDECLHEAWEYLGIARNGRQASLKVNLSAADTSCEFDPFALRQVFRNVLENSLAACDDPVEVEVHFVDDALEGRPAISVSIRDNGSGLSTEQQAHMFDEFYTTKTRGTGLGLPIARRLVEAHKGRIAAASAPTGRGTEVVITLPRKQT